MALRITANTLFMKHTLEVHSKGVTYYETAGIGGVRKFKFLQIDLILISPENVLSFQVEDKVFSIPANPGNKTHQKTIAALLEGVKGAGEDPY